MIDAEALLNDCETILTNRGKQYGDAAPLYKSIALMWSGYLGVEVTPTDVCILMSLMKAGRLSQGVDDSDALDDTYIDAINYIALARGLD
jgi:hypothetical protein